ncbi:uncharacterized protein LOC135108542 [Scylla paramamosain]|uniref:uncharacterized protein LOC135108542 n=1 Tax=Scylla paramamosain TaxID=85552 RepID=UPI00308393E8
MPPTDVFTQRYVNTTTKHYGDLQDLMTAYNITDNRQIVAGPLGFGNAVQLDKSRKQCLIIQDTEDTKDNTYDPSLATEGFSLSLWIKSEYTEQEFFDAKFYDKYLKECFVSTGGDTMGHKGVTIYQQGIFLIAEVSTGSQYWQVMVPGAVPHDKWTNVGVRWAATVGLELAVNSDIKSMMKHPKTTTASTDTPVLETTIGCCRNHDSETQSLFLYDGFSDVEVDEYSLWDRYLGGNDTIYFLGGYVGEPAYFTPDIFKSLLQSTDLEKPEQRAMAVEVLKGYMTHIEAQEKGDEDYEEYAEGEEEEAVDAQNPNTTAADGAAAASKSQQFQDLVSITMQLSQNSGLEDVQTAEDTRRSLDILFMAGKLLKPKHRKDWKKLAEQEDGISAMEFASHLEKFILNSGLAHARSDRPSPRIAAAYDGVCVQLNVITVKDLVGPSEDFATPIHLESDANEEAWTKCNDHVEIPRDMFTDERCSDRKAVIASFIYTTLHKIQGHPLPVTAGKLNPKVENFIDSKVASFRVAVTPVMRASGKVDPAMPPCNPNPLKSKLKSNFHHLSTMQTSRRHLLFHGNLTTSKLEARRCAWYNPKTGQHGQWEGEQCRVWQSFEGGTKCMCRKQGMYAVVAEMVEPMVVPEKPEWLVVVRYVLYGLSAACLLFFIFVVAFAGDLKEQFHLMGLCLAAYLLAGSIFMVVSDAEEVRTDRHACTAIGTLLHFCYLAAGAWMAMIGHASFRCVTSGIVGGRMKQYGYLSAGMPLVSVGCTYTFFLYDLGNDPRCFISWYDSPKEVFFAPQIIFCWVALFCALVIFFNLHTAAFRNKPSMEDYRSFSLGASLLIVYFSLTWTLAVVTYIDFELDVDFYPVFQILNGLSGVMLLVCLGACSSRFRMVLAGQAKLKLRNSSNRSDGGGGDGGRDTGVLIPPPAASPRRFAPSPRRVAPSPIPSTAPTSLSPLPSRPPSSNTLEVPGVRPRSTASLI